MTCSRRHEYAERLNDTVTTVKAPHTAYIYACLLVGLSVSSSHSLADANNAVSAQYIPNLISTTRRRHDLITPIFVMSIFILTTSGDDAMLTVSVSCLSVCINVTQNVVHEFRHFLDQWCFYTVQSGANNQTQRIRIETSCEGPLGASFSSLGHDPLCSSEPFLGPHHVHMLRICPASE